MRSATSRRFWVLYRDLPAPVRQQARAAYRQFERDPVHPSLRFKEVDAAERIWSVRIGRGSQAPGRRRGDQASWFWVGAHTEYDRLV